jgi:hypothetical protein
MVVCSIVSVLSALTGLLAQVAQGACKAGSRMRGWSTGDAREAPGGGQAGLETARREPTRRAQAGGVLGGGVHGRAGAQSGCAGKAGGVGRSRGLRQAEQGAVLEASSRAASSTDGKETASDAKNASGWVRVFFSSAKVPASGKIFSFLKPLYFTSFKPNTIKMEWSQSVS